MIISLITLNVKGFFRKIDLFSKSSTIRPKILELSDNSQKLADTNGAGNVDVDDMNILVNIILGYDNADRYEGRADIDESGNVDIDDVNAIVNIMLAQ